MSIRFLLTGLAVLTGLLVLAALPVVAHGHTPDPYAACTIKGTSGDDYLVGSATKNDIICGYGGDDIIAGQGGRDTLHGGPGNDQIQGDSGVDALYGGRGNDYLWMRDALHDHGYGGRGYDKARIDPFKDVVGNVESHN